MNRFMICMLVVLLLAGTCTGCRQAANPTNASPGDNISVVATIFAPYDFAREIAGEQADITMLLPPASESHSYEPTPQDVIKIQNCDVFIYVGGESDTWVGDVLKSMDTSNIKMITLMDCVSLAEEKLAEGMEEEEEGAVYDEHVWTSPKNTKLIISRINDVFCEADAKNAALYKANTETYLGKLDKLDASFQAVVDGAARKTIVFGDRFPFQYFADAYGLRYFAAFPGCSTETEPSAATIAFLIDKVKEENIPVVFHAELSNGKMANTISEATGANVRLFHACHNISKTEFENGANYLDLMTQNVSALKEALW